ncbi:hypothetical protein M407DRAFT_226980 [Tulasnella calospora MUT 4182]|uniref:Uncharacterized protein n=1 Tax=Tulasnella calospora MUT 4182 TaxID=1051891 RepID=A0A0C3LIS2_9AGAM|nr:hypothetical protein M407DRAFT_226980 [Tulasnella calospora MUT 4182]
MKSQIISLTSALLAAVPFAASVPAPIPPECPLVDVFVFSDPFEATALPGYYLESAKGVAVLVKGPLENTFSFDEGAGPLGLWNAGPTVDGCAGYSYLNAHQIGSLSASTSYSSLTYDAVATTTWNITIGADLKKLGFPTSSDFLACKRPAGSLKKGKYVLFLQNPGVVGPASSTSATTLNSGDGEVLLKTSCVSTKIHVNPAA